ncbi:MAG TPA: acetyl-CoA carboxylase biotin carboxyl carrier protein subunit [Selenomonadales bacterium]|nr:acetyl-CoA carboxylase biotin carboxyl carrier protein subunit [Selenomonadales bacterium]
MNATTYTITLNGKTYDVVVQKKTAGTAAPALSVVPQAAPAPAPQPAAPPTPGKAAAPAAGGSYSIAAPMPGKVIALKVAVGDAVQEGQEVMVVEAMKMHNPILAARAGVVRAIHVKTGEAIQTGQNMITLE